MSREKGKEGENIAQYYLQKKGYTILQKNIYSRYGEIDIIALKEQVLHLVEVKNYKPNSLVPSIFSIAESKQQKLQATLETLLDTVEEDFEELQFDAILVQNGIVIEHLKNIINS